MLNFRELFLPNASGHKKILMPIGLAVVLFLGVAMRMYGASLGHNYDVDSYILVAKIMANGGNVYIETSRYNYGPVWFYVLHFLNSNSFFPIADTVNFRMRVALFLTIIDVLIFLFLYKKYTFKVGILFFLNPISIVISGYHSQFDNFAVLLALLPMAYYHPKLSAKLKLVCLILIGLSLSIKHILFIFPFWLAFKEKSWSGKILVLLIPYVVFLGGFLAYIPEGLDGVMQNVFLYRSFSNGPFWALFSPFVVYTYIPGVILFILALFILGIFVRTKSSLYSLHIYLIALVVFSSAIANQYLAIPIASISVLWNWGYLLYTISGTLFFVTLALIKKKIFNGFEMWGDLYSYYILIACLGFGLFLTLVKKEQRIILNQRITSILNYFFNEINRQIKAPWRL